ncbi:MAG: nucleotidyltransferase domain-containing protein [archaeon]|nr:nucleotidyltransferase domain-containing protein [archaeon]
MKQLPRLVEITPKGRIVAALIEGPKSYGELKSATGLSDRWLSKKLRELSSTRIIEHYGNRYRLRNLIEIIDVDLIFAQLLQTRASLKVKARLIAEEISYNKQVVAVVLFGSVAKGKAKEESDIDILIVVDREMDDQLNSIVYNLMFKYDVSIEAIIQTYDELIENLQAKTAFSFGLLEGYQVLYDHGGVEGLLSIKKREMEEDWVYDGEAGAWIQKRDRHRLPLLYGDLPLQFCESGLDTSELLNDWNPLFQSVYSGIHRLL